jgi:hypothetical protein
VAQCCFRRATEAYSPECVEGSSVLKNPSMPLGARIKAGSFSELQLQKPCKWPQYSEGVVHFEHQGPEIELPYIVYPHKYALRSIRGTSSERCCGGEVGRSSWGRSSFRGPAAPTRMCVQAVLKAGRIGLGPRGRREPAQRLQRRSRRLWRDMVEVSVSGAARRTVYFRNTRQSTARIDRTVRKC